MNIYRVKKGVSPLKSFVRKTPVEEALSYVRKAWSDYVEKYRDYPPPLASRNERCLTEGLGIFLRDQKVAGKQNVAGCFIVEFVTGDLFENGTPGLRSGRVDLVWLLQDEPALQIEFKILDGTGKLNRFYLYTGLAKFVDEIYGRRMQVGAMCGLILPDAPDPIAPLTVLIEANPFVLDCYPEGHPPIRRPSSVGGSSAEFDTVHRRRATGDKPIKIAHMFLQVP